ncbi:MAG TPA: hypothetical protein VHF89_11255 [Solirubrobacteraceae bacterium]|nr:hypothetical protein [Solirubrobacteraceae bacterium]
MTSRLRRLGFGVALATGLSLVGLSVGGMASLDADLRAAAAERPALECPYDHAPATTRDL